MKHVGDITKIKGNELPIVDVITGGSPCQDLSVAGKRAGLAGERSGLFMEQIRIIKEMRDECVRQIQLRGTDEPIRPRYMVWENVPGAFSSNKGADFQAVLEETAKVAKGDARIPGPPGGKWPSAGAIMGNGWSIAWRVHDAQFWGVPQRRKRIALVADFGGLSAPQILFERKGMPGNPSESGEQRQTTPGAIGGSAETAGRAGIYDVRISSDGITPTLEAGAGEGGNNMPMVIEPQKEDPVYCLQGNGIDRADTAGCQGKGWREGASYTLNTLDRPAVAVIENHPADSRVKVSEGGVFQSLTSRMGTGGGNVPMVMEPQTVMTMQAIGEYKKTGTCSSLKQRDFKDATDLVVGSFYPQMKAESNCYTESDASVTLVNGTNPGYQNGIITYGFDRSANFCVGEEKTGSQVAQGLGMVCKTYQEKTGTLCNCKGISNQLATDNMFVANSSIVRRLTPMECERLQGYPDGWTDIGDWKDSKGKIHKGESDSPRYKALGNSIALPFWQWMAERICRQYDRPATMASLFDGIGGFPLVFSRCGADPVWASEIEEFPIAVTKIRFPDV